jgi:hypothetical protein
METAGHRTPGQADLCRVGVTYGMDCMPPYPINICTKPNDAQYR